MGADLPDCNQVLCLEVGTEKSECEIQILKAGMGSRNSFLGHLFLTPHLITGPFFLKFYFIFKLYKIVLVLPNIEMNPPQVACIL